MVSFVVKMPQQLPLDPSNLCEAARQCLRFLQETGIAYELVTHKALFRVRDHDDSSPRLPGSATKNLCLLDRKENCFLVTMRQKPRADLRRLGQRLNAAGRLSFLKQDALHRLLGIAPGMVTPLALMHDSEKRFRLYIDEKLLEKEPLWVHPLDNRASVGLSFRALEKFLRQLGVSPSIGPVDLLSESGTSS